MTEQTATTRLARTAGLAYLAVIAGGVFAQGIAREQGVVDGDAAATARAIADHLALWRWGIAIHLLYLVAALAVAVILATLFRPTHPTLARFGLALGITTVATEAVGLVCLAVPLTMTDERAALAALAPAEHDALAYLAVQLFTTSFDIALLFFAGFCAVTGVLILRTRLVPPALGALMLLAGACYLVNTLADIVAPATELSPAIFLPCFVAELALAVWLVVRGARVS